MHGLLNAVVALCGAAVWLVLLEATDFNGATIGMGLLVGLGMIDRAHRATP